MTHQDEAVARCGLRVGMLVRVTWGGIPQAAWKTLDDWGWGGSEQIVSIPEGTKGVVVAEYYIPPSTPGAVGFPAILAYHPMTGVELRFNVLYQILWEDERLMWSWPAQIQPLEKTPEYDPFWEGWQDETT